MGNITATDRLIFTILFSIIIHLIVVLGVSFDATSPLTNPPLANLDITLVKHQTDLAPEEADFLAQANNEGGGETEKKSPEPTPDAPIPEAKELPSAAPESIPLPITPPTPEPVIQPEPEPVVVPEPPAPEPVKPVPPKPVEKQPTKQAEIITQAKAERKVEVPVEISEKVETMADIAPKPVPKLSARELMLQAKSEISFLEQKLNASAKALSKRPKKRPVSSRTKEYEAAAYHEAWRKKVERIGNLNYPQEAKQQGINGSLMLSVDINPDGSVPPDGIVISRSSGHKVLDDAAIKIVRLGAPYAAIPKDVLQGYDMITIIRTWKFETNSGLMSR